MATGLSQEMQRNRSGFLKPAASSPVASDVGMAAGAGFKRSNRLSVRKINRIGTDFFERACIEIRILRGKNGKSDHNLKSRGGKSKI